MAYLTFQGNPHLIFFKKFGIVFTFWQKSTLFFYHAAIKSRIPPSFRALYPNCTCIIGCSEIQIETTQKQKLADYSKYKQKHTLKFLLAIAPSGEITFISRGFGGRTTDAQLTADSGFLELLWPGSGIQTFLFSFLIISFFSYTYIYIDRYIYR